MQKTHKLIQVESTHNNVRTKETEGYAPIPPVVGKSFTFFADAIDTELDLRTITTSMVKTLEKQGGNVLFTTGNSTYLLEVYDDAE